MKLIVATVQLYFRSSPNTIGAESTSLSTSFVPSDDRLFESSRKSNASNTAARYFGFASHEALPSFVSWMVSAKEPDRPPKSGVARVGHLVLVRIVVDESRDVGEGISEGDVEHKVEKSKSPINDMRRG